MSSPALSDELQVWGFEDDFTVFTDGSLGFALACTPIHTQCFSDEALNDLSSGIAQFLNGLPSGIDIQFVQDIEPGNDEVINQHKALSGQSQNQIAIALTASRTERLLLEDQDGLLPRHTLKVFVRRPLSALLVDRPKFFSKEALFPEISEKRMAREKDLTTRLRENILQGLAVIGISANALSADETANLLYAQWNPSRKLPLKCYNPEEVRSSLLFSDVGIALSGFAIGTKLFRVISLKALPEQTYSSMARVLRELPFDSRLFVTIHVPDQAKEIASLQTQRRIAFSMATGKTTGVSDIDSNAKFQDLQTLLEEMIAQGQKVFHVSISVLLKANTEDELDVQADLTLSKFRELGGAEAMTETLAAFDIFSQMALPNARAKDRIKKIKTSNLADLVPAYGPWAGHRKPSVLLKSRESSLIALDFFDSSLSSANQLVSGGSGSGKSFMTNILLLQMLKENPKVFFVDIGGSYKKLTENLGGQFIELGVNEALSINPFDLSPGDETPSSQKIKFLLGMVELMVKEEGSDRLPKLARAEIEDAIQQSYEEFKMPTLSHLKATLLKHENPEIRVYGKILSPWCGNTPYGKFIDRPTTIEIANDIIAFELKGLDSYPDLQAICLYIITDLVWREVQKDRIRMKFLVFDECWKLLKDNAGVGFMEEVFRTFRKYNASAIAISQDLNDFLSSSIASALLPNCPIKWILMQNQSNFSKMKEALGLNENEIALIQSLRQVKGKYSEAFLIAGPEHRSITVIESTPLELWLSTTDPKDLAMIDQLKLKEPMLTSFEILTHLSETFPEGAAAIVRSKS